MKVQHPISRLIIFVKAPHPGLVKSRLASGIGEDAACAAYKIIVKRLLKNLCTLCNIEIRFSPDNADADVRKWLGGDFTFAPQGSGDLGARLHRAFQENFNAGNQKVAIIGSDCPYVTTNDVESAFSVLATHDVVLGPATDGGYWLIGLQNPQQALFENIPWSTAGVFQTTLRHCQAANLSVHQLRTLDDIDIAEDWSKYLNSL